MDDNMRAELCAATVENTAAAYPEFCCAVLHSDRGSQYTRASYRAALNEYGVKQSDIVNITLHNSLKNFEDTGHWNKYPRSVAK